MISLLTRRDLDQETILEISHEILVGHRASCVTMPQDTQTISNGVGPETIPIKHHQDDKPEKDSRDQGTIDEQEADVKENLEFHKGTDEMPELKDDQLLRDDEQISLDFSIPPEVMEYARRMLGETDEIKCQTLQELRDMIYGNSDCNISLRYE